MKNKTRLQTAISIATEAHEGQFRHGNKEPYINHCLRVLETVKKYTDDENVHIAAILHDTVEDTDSVTLNGIAVLFGAKVAHYVYCLTNTVSKVSVGEALYEDMNDLRLSQACNEVKLIKTADMIDNLKDITKTRKPHRALAYLDSKTNIIKSVKESLGIDHPIVQEILTVVNSQYKILGEPLLVL